MTDNVVTFPNPDEVISPEDQARIDYEAGANAVRNWWNTLDAANRPEDFIDGICDALADIIFEAG